MKNTEKKLFKWKKVLIGEWSWKRPIRLVFFVYFSLFIIAFFFSNLFLFPIPSTSYDDKTLNLVYFESSDGTKLAARIWKTPYKEKGTILYFHGNAVDIGLLDGLALNLATYGYTFIAMDYRGYGLSEGSPSEQNCYDDADVFLKHLAQLGYKREDMILWGRSLGGGIATDLAQRHEFRGLVLESTFCTAFRTATIIPIFPFDKFNNLKKIKNVEEPTFFLHGAKDEVISEWHTEKLQKAHLHRNKRIVVQNAGHNDLWNADRTLEIKAMAAFFEIQIIPIFIIHFWHPMC